MERLRKRDWLLAAALVPYVVLWFPFALVGTVLIMAWGLRPRPKARKRAKHVDRVRERWRTTANGSGKYVCETGIIISNAL